MTSIMLQVLVAQGVAPQQVRLALRQGEQSRPLPDFATSRRRPGARVDTTTAGWPCGPTYQVERGREGGSKFPLSKAEVRPAQSAIAHRDRSVSELCRELGIRPGV